MITSLKPYDKIIDSREPWLGEIPSLWSLIRTKALLNERSEKGYPNEPMLAATQTKGVVRKEEYENRTVLAMKDFHLLKLVREGDFVISLRSFQGGIEYAREQGIISPAYTILYPKNPNNHAYLSRLFKSRPYIENLTLYVTGIRQGQNIDYEKLSRSLLPFPPLSEQTTIVRYLDYMDRLIQRYIRAKQKQIRLLQEQKQAIIHQAVTRGLNPDVPLKPSGVEWLGDIPKSWKTSSIRRFSRVYSGGTPDRSNPEFWENGTIPWLSSGDVNKRHIYQAKQYITQLGYSKSSAQWIPSQSVVMALAGQGRTKGLVATIEFNTTGNQSLAVICPNKEIMQYEFLAYSLESQYFRIRSLVGDGLRDGLNLEIIKSIIVCFPEHKEQKSIVNYLNKMCTLFEETSQNIVDQVSRIQEYRTRLIADVVTGKLDVREAAAGLPEELAAPELEEETGEEEQDLEQPQAEGQEE